MRYLRRPLGKMFEQGITAIAPTREANEDYNRRVDETHAETVWTHRGMRPTTATPRAGWSSWCRS